MAKIAPLSCEGAFPRVLSGDELRFEILNSARARDLMVATILSRDDRYQVRAPAPAEVPFWNVGNR